MHTGGCGVTKAIEKAEFEAQVQRQIEEEYSNSVITQKVMFMNRDLVEGYNNYTGFFVQSYETVTNTAYTGPGVYYLVVKGHNIHNWNVQIEDYY